MVRCSRYSLCPGSRTNGLGCLYGREELLPIIRQRYMKEKEETPYLKKRVKDQNE
jgi:hypothetical protein